MIAAIASCWRSPDAPRSPIDEMGWLVGVWHAPTLDAEWARVGRSLYGVAFTDTTFEINLIADRDAQSRPRPVTLVSTTWSWDAVERDEHMDFALASADARKLEFVDGKHGVVVVTRMTNGWRGEFLRASHPTPIMFVMTPAQSRADRSLEAVDRAATFLEHHTVRGSGVIGDHGYTFGTFEARGRRGSYCHVWKRDGGSWAEVAWVTQLE